LSKQTNNIVANKICVVSKIGLGTGIFGKMAVKGLNCHNGYARDVITINIDVCVVIVILCVGHLPSLIETD